MLEYAKFTITPVLAVPLIETVIAMVQLFSNRFPVPTLRLTCELSSSVMVAVDIYSEELILAFAQLTATISTIIVSSHSINISFIQVIMIV